VFENRVLRRILGPKRDEIVGGWKKLPNKELHNLYFPPNIMRTKLTGHVTRMGKKRNAIFVGKPEGMGPLGRPRSRWKDNIKMGLREAGCGV
jgi:hypothetical protein